MATNSQSRVVALNLGKRVVNQIWTSKARDSILRSALPVRRAAHTSVYDKNPDDHHPTVVPDNVIPPQSETYWAPHPQTGVFGPPAEHTTTAGERGFHPSAADVGQDSVLQQQAWFRYSGLEDLEKPH